MAGDMGAVYFSHGQESGPWGTKISRLAPIATTLGFAVESIDYRGIDDPDRRVEKLLASGAMDYDRLVLVGSSMGGYVATVASEILRPAGLFLMAPAFYLDGFGAREPIPHAGLMAVVHAWEDDVIPVENSIRFAERHYAELHLIHGDHGLNGQISFIEQVFKIFLDSILQMQVRN
jgi:pimeloyl-ACP methyl ester carboxylesterase